MNDPHPFRQHQDEAGQYEIRIRGHLDELWAGWFDGLALTLDKKGDTLIRGRVNDQAALFGLLRKVRDAGMPLISVQRIPVRRGYDLCRSHFVSGRRKSMKTLLKVGGAAALLHACALIVGIIMGVTIMFPLLDADPGQYLAFVAAHPALIYVWNLVAYWGTAVTLVPMTLVLYHRLKSVSPVLIQTATVFGLIWAALIIASANLMLRDSGMISSAYAKDPAQAAALWAALDAVETGIVSGNELVGSLWVLLLSLVALRPGGLPKGLSYFGVALSLAGALTLIPALSENMGMMFGTGMIVWSLWLGFVLLQNSRDVSRQPLNLVVKGEGLA